MDIWKYYDIIHRKHLVCNPMHREKLERMFSLLGIKQGSSVIDIGCGKGEILITLAELFDISGTGIDISPYFLKAFRQKAEERVPQSEFRFLEMDAAEYKAEENELFDLSMCIGASWIYQGYEKTIKVLKKMTRPGGIIIIGEPYWIKEPANEYLDMIGMKKDDVGSHCSNVERGEKQGLNCIYTLVSSGYDWDHYETLQWLSAHEYIVCNPDDPDNPELLSKINEGKKSYLLYGRETLGWAIYVFRK